MSELSSTTGVIALAAAAAALVALVAVVVVAIRLRRTREAQRVVLGGDSERDLIEHAAALERRVAEAERKLEAAGAELGRRLDDAERRLTSTVSNSSVIRYDAYNEMSGRQSSSIALLDDDATGVVLSAILHRDQARFYAKWVVNGSSELDLSPEEREAIDEAMAGGRGGASRHEPAQHPPGGVAR